MVLYGYLAAVTSLELVTGVIILPQRQTVLAAKQAAEVDLLTTFGDSRRLTAGASSTAWTPLTMTVFAACQVPAVRRR
jgi:hypothetical protein